MNISCSSKIKMQAVRHECQGQSECVQPAHKRFAFLNRVAVLAFSCALVFSLLPASAFAQPANDVQEAADLQVQVNSPSGTSGTCTWEIDTNGNLTIRPTDGTNGTLDKMAFGWKDHADLIRTVTVAPGVNAPEEFTEAFRDCAQLTQVDLSRLNVSEVTTMRGLFWGCSSLSSISLELNAPKVTEMGYMFYQCSRLESVDLTKLKTSSVTSMNQMFYGCSSLFSVSLSSSKVFNMKQMFQDCSSLASLDLSNLDTTSATDMENMFSGCSSLISLDLSNFDTSNAKTMKGMFSSCTRLNELNLSSFDTSNVAFMESMFFGCSSLGSLDLSSFNLKKVEDMGGMFKGCSELKFVTLPGSSTESLGEIPDMFNGCKSLGELNLSSFDTTHVRNMGNMFTGCDSLGKVTLGASFTFYGDPTYVDPDPNYPPGNPKTTLPGGMWKSEDTGLIYSALSIAQDRDKVADTYSRVTFADATIAEIPNQLYTGNEIRPDLTVTLGGRTLVANRDYVVDWQGNNTAVGRVQGKVEGIGDYSNMGSKPVSFKIVEADLGTISLSKDKFAYDGSPQRPIVTVISNGRTLREGTDYVIHWPDDLTNAGTKTITVIGIGNYAGTKTAAYTIAPIQIPDMAISPDKFFYDGSQKRPHVTVQLGGRILKEGTDYDITWPADTTNVGTKTVVVTGKGNYSGQVRATYFIDTTPHSENPANGTWIYGYRGWWYSYSDGTWAKGWLEDGSGHTYYLDGDGWMVTGWRLINNAWYYFYPSGAMAVSAWICPYGTWYYLDGDGRMLTGQHDVNGKTYRFDGNGAMLTGWSRDGDTWYYSDYSGAVLKSTWICPYGTWYYLGGDGKMLTGNHNIGGTNYRFDGSGAMLTGWIYDGSNWYYANSSGAVLEAAWVYLHGTWYYLGGDGKMLVGQHEIDGKTYRFDGSGAMLTGWQQDGDDWYYFEPSGAMATNQWIPGAYWYWVGKDGKMARSTLVDSHYLVDAEGRWIPGIRL